MPDPSKQQPAPGTRPTFTRPASAGDPSPLRKVRVPENVWVPACDRATRDGVRISAVVRDLLRAYADGDTPSGSTDETSP